MLRWTTTVLMGVLLLAGATLAAAAPENTDAKAVAPYVGAQTLAVVHIDMAGVDLPSAKQAALDVLAAVKLPEADGKEAEKGMDEAMQAASAWIAQFRAAGAMAGPKPAGKLIVQAADEKSAKALQDLAHTGLDRFVAETGMKAQQGELTRLILPKQDNTRLVLEVGKEELTALANLATPPLAAARARAQRVKSASNIRQILQGCYLQGNDRKGAWPDDLKTLAKTSDRSSLTRRGPRQPPTCI